MRQAIRHERASRALPGRPIARRSPTMLVFSDEESSRGSARRRACKPVQKMRDGPKTLASGLENFPSTCSNEIRVPCILSA